MCGPLRRTPPGLGVGLGERDRRNGLTAARAGRRGLVRAGPARASDRLPHRQPVNLTHAASRTAAREPALRAESGAARSIRLILRTGTFFRRR